MENIKVSIIVCSYNQEKYIRQTIDSILSQKHEYSFELIICDDASNDLTPNIISEYAKLNKEIIPVLREKNLGIVKNLFDGVTRCSGEYIMVCGGDDYYLPGKIEIQIKYLDNHQDVGLLYSDVQLISEDGRVNRIQFGQSYSSIEELLRKYSIPAPTMVFRKKDIIKYLEDVNPLEHDWLMEDVPLTIWFQANKKLTYLPLVCVNYRILQESICHQKTPDKMLKFEQSTFSVLKYFQEKYPNLINLDFIYWRHLTSLLNRPSIISEYQDYCYYILSKYKELGFHHFHYIYILRIKYPLINKAYRFIRLSKKGVTYLKNLTKQKITL